MIFSMIGLNGREQVCCIDKAGRRAFPVREFFGRNLKGLYIESNQIDKIPDTMEEFIHVYNVFWIDDMALFFGGRPELAIKLDPEKGWTPLIRPEESWSPIYETRGLSLLE